MKKFLKFSSLILAILVLATSCSKNTAVTETTAEAKVEVNAPVLENSIFKVEMPSKFDGLYETEVKDNSINFYDSECKFEGFPGWVFGLAAYENPADWAGGPIEKVGELQLNSGKLYDVVIIYPTESQFGFDRDMPAKYKSLYDARFEVASNVVATSGEKVAVGAGTKGENIYKAEIDKHLTALNEKWDADRLEKENMSTMYAVMATGEEDVYREVGYIYKDINVDGIDELLIGEIDEGEWNGVIYDVYTMVNRKPEHVVSGWDRNRYYLLDSGMLLNEGSGGAGLSETKVYNLQTNSVELFYQFGFKYDEYENKDNPWFISYDSNEENRTWENTTEDKIKEMEARYEKAKVKLTPFSTLK